MDIEDKKIRGSFKQQMVIRLPACDLYDKFANLFMGEYEIVRADTAQEMEEIVSKARNKIACVVIDAKRAINANFEVNKKMNQDMRFIAIPFIALTLKPSKEELDACVKAEISEYISLPEMDELIKLRVRNAIKGKDSATFDEIERMLSQLPSNIYLKDKEGRYVFSTHYWHHLDTADDPDWTIRGKTDLDIRKDKDNAKLAMEADKKLLATGEGTSYIIEEKSDGVSEFLELIKRPVYDNKGNINGIIALINNVTEFELLKKELEKRSKTDLLTGLLNKTTTQELCDMAINASFKKTGKIALMVIDADHFKNINDTYGHAVGDLVLKKIAQSISDNFKGMDICGRFGGDEFVVMLREVKDSETAIMLGKKLSIRVKEMIKDEPYHDDVTLSIGIAISPENGKSFSELFEAADKALYYVKQHGRNNQCIYSDEL